jgi:hypothetical protein
MTLVDTIDGMSTEKAQAYLDSLERPEEVFAFGDEGELLLHPDDDKVVKAFYYLHNWGDRHVSIGQIIDEAFDIHKKFPYHFVEPIGSEGVNDDWPFGKDLDWSAIRAWMKLKEKHEELFFPPEAKRIFLRERYPIAERPKYITRLVEWNGPEEAVDPNKELMRLKEQFYYNYPYRFGLENDGSAPEILRRGMSVLQEGEEIRYDRTEDWIKAYFGEVHEWDLQIAYNRISDAALRSIVGETEFKALYWEFRNAEIIIAHPEVNFGLVWVPEEEREKYPLVEKDDHAYRLGLDKSGENRIVFFEGIHREEGEFFETDFILSF